MKTNFQFCRTLCGKW